MRADSDAHIKRALERNSQPSPRHLEFSAGLGQRHVNVVSALRDAQASGRGNVRLNLVRDGAFLVTELERGQAAGVERHVGVGRVRIQALAEDQHCLLVFVSAGVRKRNVGRQCNVAGNFLPHEVKGVRRRPHILAAAGYGVGLLCIVVFDRPRMQDRANVCVTLKHSDGCAGSLCLE